MIELRAMRREALVESHNNRDLTDRRSRRCIASRLLSSRITRNSQLAPRHAVTLIELMIAAAIIATLSAAFVGVSRSAMEHARTSRTKYTVSKLHALLMERYASYINRRVDLHPDIEYRVLDSANVNFTGKNQGLALADMRLLATRELMKLEMPDRWSDILGRAVDTTNNPATQPSILQNRPTLAQVYFNVYNNLPRDTQEDLDRLRRHQGAECLYMVIMHATGDGEARTAFSEQDIADVDGDGAPEFIDGWGNPISYLRWPAGFHVRSDLMTGNPDTDHDPFDLFRRDVDEQLLNVSGFLGPELDDYGGPLRNRLIDHFPRLRDSNDYDSGMVGGFRLVPLIYSSGPDGISDIHSYRSHITLLDPYEPTDSNLQLGAPQDLDEDGDNFLDNIHNHLQEGR